MNRCVMCDEPNPMYIPADDVDDRGLYSCNNPSCGFELEGPRRESTSAPERPRPPFDPGLHRNRRPRTALRTPRRADAVEYDSVLR